MTPPEVPGVPPTSGGTRFLGTPDAGRAPARADPRGIGATVDRLAPVTHRGKLPAALRSAIHRSPGRRRHPPGWPRPDGRSTPRPARQARDRGEALRDGIAPVRGGDPETVAERPRAYQALGIDTCVMPGYPHMEEAIRFTGLVFALIGEEVCTSCERSKAGSAVDLRARSAS